MWKDCVEAIGVLSVLVLPILIAFCVVGSIIAVLRAVSRGSHTESTKR
jgi:flagellar biosynthesis protein FliQ